MARAPMKLQMLVACICHAAPFMIALLPISRLHAEENSPREEEEDWQVIYLQNQRVGYLHSRFWTQRDGEVLRLWTEAVTRMRIRRFGTSLSMTIRQLTEEDSDGNLLSFEFATDNPPMSKSIISGRVDGETLRLRTTTAGKTSESSQEWDTAVKSPAYQERLLEDDPIKPGQTISFKTFDPQFLKVGNVSIRGETPGETTLLDGTTTTLNRVTMTHSLVPGLLTTVYSNEAGSVLKTEANLLGMVSYSVTREEALKEIAEGELDLAVDTLIRVDPIEQVHRTRRVVYEMTLDRVGLPTSLPTGPTQQVEQIDDRTFRITVTAARPRGVSSEASTSDSVSADYRASSRYVECDHPAVAKLANQAAGNLTDPDQIAAALESSVHEQIESKNFSTALATAAEVAQSLEGDCTEHAVLLAALLRVKNIPSRVVVGLVYAAPHSAFAGHMWTEAYLGGRWVPLDATLGQGGIGGGHIKFADSSLADDGPAPVTTFLPLINLLEHMSLRVVEAE